MQQAVGLHTFLTSWNWWSNQENDTFLKTILIASNQCFSRVRLPKKKYLLQPRQNMSCAELPVGMLQTHLIFSGSGPKTRVTWLKKKKILFPKVSTNQLPMRVKILIRKCATIASSTTNHSGKQTSLLFNFPRDWPWEHAIPQLFVQKKNRKLVNYHRHQIQQSRAWLILSKINKQLHLDPFRQRAALLISACSKQPEVISCVFFPPHPQKSLNLICLKCSISFGRRSYFGWDRDKRVSHTEGAQLYVVKGWQFSLFLSPSSCSPSC